MIKKCIFMKIYFKLAICVAINIFTNALKFFYHFAEELERRLVTLNSTQIYFKVFVGSADSPSPVSLLLAHPYISRNVSRSLIHTFVQCRMQICPLNVPRYYFPLFPLLYPSQVDNPRLTLAHDLDIAGIKP